MPGMIAIAITKKAYRGQQQFEGKSVSDIMRSAMEVNLEPIVQDVRRKLPGSRLKASTHIRYKNTPHGASANLRIGDGVPFAYMHAKWGSHATKISPKTGRQHLAIPLSQQARDLAESAGPRGLMNLHPMLHRGWGKGAHTLFYGGMEVWHARRGVSEFFDGTPAFRLVHNAFVKPSVNLQEVTDNLRLVTAISIRNAFKGYDFGYASVRRDLPVYRMG